MSSFTFHEVQLLNITKDDRPQIQIQDGVMTLMATRGGDQIMITAPVQDATEISKIAAASQIKAAIKPANKRRVFKPRRNFGGRQRYGENHPKAKLTEQDIREMRALASDEAYKLEFESPHHMYMDLGNIYKVHYTTVYKIVHGQSWKHVVNA